jgi:MYXO-CTERM domain-containing protein
VVCALTGLLAGASPARANNAFPDTGQVLLPPDRPDTIILGTNFGLVITEDGGTTWRWTCEHDEGLNAVSYELTPGPRHRLISLASSLVFSDDLACTWHAPEPAEPFIYDAFPDPGTPDRYLIAIDRVVGTATSNVVVESTNGAQSLGRVLFTAPSGLEVSTLEVARSDPRTAYLTMYPLTGTGPNQIARSTDGGETWSVVTPRSDVGNADLLIAAIDPADARKIYFRVLTGDGHEKLALSSDGGDSLHAPLTADGALSSFVRTADGTILVGTLKGGDGHLFRSTDGGTSFTALPSSIRPRALAERAGKLYAATDDLQDGYALGVSEDAGTTWRRVMSFKDIGTVSHCGPLPEACANSCAMLNAAGLIQPSLCGAARPDGGAVTSTTGGGGCSCRLGGRGGPGALVLLAALAIVARRRRRG